MQVRLVRGKLKDPEGRKNVAQVIRQWVFGGTSSTRPRRPYREPAHKYADE